MAKLGKEYYSKKDGKILEKGIQREICEWLNEKQFFFWRSNNIPAFGKSNDTKFRFRSMPKFSMAGVPDIIVINEGVFIGIEVKREGNPLSEDQVDFGHKLLDHGGQYVIAHSLDELKKNYPFVNK